MVQNGAYSVLPRTEAGVKMVQNEAYSVLPRSEAGVEMVQNEAYSTLTQHKPSQMEDSYEHAYY